MKTLLFGVVLIVLLGVAGFFYRNVMEQRGNPEPVACTMDAKDCPDGSFVGRTGPSCEFAACASPNVELPQIGISFVTPKGYGRVADEPGRFSASLIAWFTKNTLSEAPLNTIVISRHVIGEGQTADDVILANIRYQPADMQAEDFERFDTVIIEGKEFRTTVIERFEAIVHSAYFLVRETDLFMFEIIEHDVTDWMEPSLVVGELPEHSALQEMLETLQVSQ